MKKIKEILKKLWDAFDGNKTLIALAIVELANLGVFGKYKSLALFLAALIGGPGMIHKAVKIGTKLKNGGK